MAINCVVVTPEKTALDEQAELVVVPLIDGEVGIQTGHAPLIGRMGYGEMRIVKGGNAQRYYVDGGFVQVADNQVSVITNRAIPATNVDLEAAKRLLAEAEKQKPTNALEAAGKEKALQQARAQVRIASR